MSFEIVDTLSTDIPKLDIVVSHENTQQFVVDSSNALTELVLRLHLFIISSF